METATAGLTKVLKRSPANLLKSLTWDRGLEPAGHKKVTANTGIAVFFADPRSPWQRGTNENTNRLLRQYFPKGTRVADYTQADQDDIANKLNTRPRKTLDWQTPASKLEELLL